MLAFTQVLVQLSGQYDGGLAKGDIKWQQPLGSVENVASVSVPPELATPMAGRRYGRYELRQL